MRYFIILLLSLLHLDGVAHADDKLSLSLPIAEDVKIGQLDNGLRYYLKKNQKPEQRLELRLVVKAGSIHEAEDQRGLAHFLEHMAFDGSRHFPKRQLVSYLQSMGIRFGADLNAYTNFNETVYVLPIPTDKAENLEIALLVLRDWANGISLDDQEIAKERQIILEEARLRKGVANRFNKPLYAELYRGSRYAKRLPIGDEAVIRNFKKSRLAAFYRDWYRPDLMAIIAVGDLNVTEFEQKLKQQFADLASPGNLATKPDTQIPVRSQDRALVLTDVEASETTLSIRYPLSKENKLETLADLRRLIMRRMAEAMLSERLVEQTQQAQPPFVNAQAAWDKLSQDYENFSLQVTFGKTDYTTAIKAVYHEMLLVRQFGFQIDEFDRTKEKILRWLQHSLAEQDKTTSANHADACLSHFLNGTPLLSASQSSELIQEVLKTIDLQQINQSLVTALPISGNKLIVFTGPGSAAFKVPQNRQLLSWVRAAEKQELKPVVLKQVAAALMARPEAGEILSEQFDEKRQVYEWVLSNGLKVVLKPTKFKNDEILLQAQRYGGTMLLPDAQHVAANMAVALVGGMGAGPYTATGLNKMLAGSLVSYSLGQSNYVDFVNASSGLQDLEKLLQIQYLRFTQPRMDKALFAGMIQREQDSVKDLQGSPDFQFSQAVEGLFYQNHSRRSRSFEVAELARLKPESMMQIYQQRFSSAYGMRFIFVGNLQPDNLRPLIKTYLASLPAQPIPLEFQDRGLRGLSGISEHKIYAGKESKAQLSILAEFPYPYSENEQRLLNLLCDIINLRIHQVLRGESALIYSGGISAGLSRLPYQHLSLAIHLPCAPENVTKVKQILFDELTKLRREGPALADLERARQALLKNHQLQLQENEFWLDELSDSYFYNQDLHDPASYQASLEALTVADLQQAANRMLSMNSYASFIWLPQAYKK